MKILKIIDDFVTNSSSDSATILIALRKGKELKEIVKKLGIPIHLPKDFYDFSEDVDYIEDCEIEVDHLTDEYYILVNSFCTASWGDDNYEMPGEELNALLGMAYELEEKGGDDCIVLHISESSMY